VEETLFNLDGKNFSIVDFADQYISALEEPEEVKERMKKTIKVLYNRIAHKEEKA
jgi:hypothetical protein